MNMSNLELKTLSFWQQQVVAAALMQRMLPNYAYFSEATGFGDYQLLLNQMDLVWQKLSLLPVKFNVELQLEKLQNNIPNYSEFDIFAVYPACDVCSGMVSLLESFEEKETDCASDVSLLSINSVVAFLEFQFQQGQVETDCIVDSDPLYLWELETQQEIFDLVSKSKPSRKFCTEIKQLVMSDRITNLAIEY